MKKSNYLMLMGVGMGLLALSSCAPYPPVAAVPPGIQGGPPPVPGAYSPLPPIYGGSGVVYGPPDAPPPPPVYAPRPVRIGAHYGSPRCAIKKKVIIRGDEAPTVSER